MSSEEKLLADEVEKGKPNDDNKLRDTNTMEKNKKVLGKFVKYTHLNTTRERIYLECANTEIREVDMSIPSPSLPSKKG